MAHLSVKLNKVALLRNFRRTGVPDLLHFARLVHEAGAHGITTHPHPDERHIRRADIPALAGLIAPWRPGFEFNIEGYPGSARGRPANPARARHDRRGVCFTAE